MTDSEAIDAVMAAGDKVEQHSFSGNMLTSTSFTSASVGKVVTFHYLQNGGFSHYQVGNV